MQPCQYSLMRRDVCPPWSTGLDLRGWGWARRLAEGWGPRLARQWLQRMSSVYREMRRGRGGDAETAAFTLYCKLHTHAHTLTQALTQKAVATLETPQALQVCMCVFVLQLACWDQRFRVTAIHTSVPDCSWTWCRLGGGEHGDADWPLFVFLFLYYSQQIPSTPL